jgi:hypothetical protein
VLLLAPVAALVVGIAVVAATSQYLAPVPSSGSPDSSGASGSSDSSASSASTGPSASHSSPMPLQQGLGYLVSIDELRERGQLAAQGVDPYDAAVADLLEWANGAVDIKPSPLQPLVLQDTDNVFVDDAGRAYGLGLAYGLTGDERYAAASRRTIRAWVDQTSTTADTCPDSGGCGTSLIIGRAGAGFPMGAELLEGSKSWTADDRQKLTTWLRDVIIPNVSHRPNNWGDAGTFLRIVASDYIGDAQGFSDAIDMERSLTDLIQADGRIPEEVRRGSAGISYTQEALQYKIGVARIAERHGIDLWDYNGAAGGSLRKAMDRLAYYWTRPQEWPDYPGPEVPASGPVWELAYAHWHDPIWIPMVLDPRPYGDRGHSAIRWTTLTNGIPIGPETANGPSGAPGSSAFPSGDPSSFLASPPPAAGPVVSGLGVRLESPLGGRIPITVSWKADTTAGTSFRIERSTDGAGWHLVDLRSNGHSARDSVSLGRVYSYRVRATRAGHAGNWAVVSNVRVVRIEPSRRTIDMAGTWSAVRFGAYSHDVALSTDQAGATITWQGSARSIGIVGPIGKTRGRMTVTVDGKREASVDLYASTYQARSALATVRLDKPGEHVVRIEAAKSSGRATVAVDDIVVLDWTLSAGQDPGS